MKDADASASVGASQPHSRATSCSPLSGRPAARRQTVTGLAPRDSRCWRSPAKSGAQQNDSPMRRYVENMAARAWCKSERPLVVSWCASPRQGVDGEREGWRVAQCRVQVVREQALQHSECPAEVLGCCGGPVDEDGA